MSVCRCGCGKSRYFGRWYAHDCPTQAIKARERVRRSAERQRLKRAEAGRKIGRPEIGDLSDEEIERRFTAYKAWLTAMRKYRRAA